MWINSVRLDNTVYDNEICGALQPSQSWFMKSVSEGEKTLVTAAIYRGSKNGTAYVECVIFFLVSPMRREPASSRAKHLLLSSFCLNERYHILFGHSNGIGLLCSSAFSQSYHSFKSLRAPSRNLTDSLIFCERENFDVH